MTCQQNSSVTSLDNITNESASPNTTSDYNSLIISGGSTLDAVDGILLVCGICGIIGNTVCVMVLLYHGPLRNKLHNLFLINHSLVDLVVCILLIPDTVASKEPAAISLACYLWRMPTVFTGLYVSSVYNIVALAIERYMEVVRPIAHRNYVTRPRVIFLLVVIWLFGPTLTMILMLQNVGYINGDCHFVTISQAALSLLGSLTFITEFCVSLFIIVLCYGLIALSSKKRIKAAENSITSASDIMSRAQRNVSITLVLVTTCFVLCTLLRQILLLLNSTNISPIDYAGSLFNASVFLNNSSCAIYPYICFHRHTEFKRGLRELFFCTGNFKMGRSGVDNEHRETSGRIVVKSANANSSQL